MRWMSQCVATAAATEFARREAIGLPEGERHLRRSRQVHRRAKRGTLRSNVARGCARAANRSQGRARSSNGEVHNCVKSASLTQTPVAKHVVERVAADSRKLAQELTLAPIVPTFHLKRVPPFPQLHVHRRAFAFLL